MTIPSIPATVFSMLGPVPVVMVDDLTSEDDEPLLGKWVPEQRCILLRANVHPLTTYVTLQHEKLHCWLWDAGAMPTEESEEERVCDSIAATLAAEFLSGT
jgi:hypothetical protein